MQVPKPKQSVFSIKRLMKSFGHALRGMGYVIRAERNMQIHLFAVVVVVVAGIWLNITETEWLAILLAMGLVVVSETMNTAIESVVDLVSPEQHPLAGRAKDVAAGAVVFATITAVLVGILVFLPKIGQLVF
ncbi:MAG: diacylglycerol kinase family protein [Chitinophagales bacterium]